MFPDLKRDSVYLIALAAEKQGCNGTIDSSAHAEENGWTRHSAGIVPTWRQKGLEVRGPHFISMDGKVVDVFRVLRMVFNPAMGSHVAHAVEMRPVLDCDCGGSNVADEDALFQDLNSFRCGDGAVYFPAGKECARRDDSFYDGMLPYNQGSGRVYLPF